MAIACFLALRPATKGIPDSIKTKLLRCKDQAFFSKMLVQIKMDVPIEFVLEDSRFGKYDKQKVIQILEDLNFYSLINRLPQ